MIACAQIVTLAGVLLAILTFTNQAQETPIDPNQIEQKSDDAYESALKSVATLDPVVTTCTITNKNGSVYQGANIVGKNNTNRVQRCDHYCVINQKGGGTYDMHCQSALQPNQTATVCNIFNNTYTFISIASVRHTCN